MGLGVVLLAIGGLLCLIAWIWLVVAGFRAGVGWGLLMLFLSWLLIPVIVFAIRFWDQAKRPVALYALGIAVNVGGYLYAVLAVGADLGPALPADAPPAARPAPESGEASPVLPPPRPTALPTHPSWEAVVAEMSEESPTSWEQLVPTPTPVSNRPGQLRWDQLAGHIGRTVVIELEHGPPVTATLEGAEESRLRIRHVIGGGEASYWVERGSVTRIRLAD